MNNNDSLWTDAPHPYWIASAEPSNYPALEDNIEVDAAIVGGGIAGITTAYFLKKAGMTVAVIEAGRILQGTTGHSTAKITSQHSLIYARLINQWGEDLARQYAEANEKAIQTIYDLSKENNINCDFSWRPAYVYTQSDQYIKDIEDEVHAASRLGIKANYLEDTPLPFAVKAAMCFDNQAQFHPLKYLQPLARKIPGNGSYIFEQSRAINIEDEQGLQVIMKNGKRISASKIIVASHFPFFDGGGLYFSRIYQERAYVQTIKIEEKFPEGMFINAEDPNRSLRSQNDENGGEMILVAGESHKTGHDNNTSIHYENLLNFAKINFRVNQVLYRWSTQDCMTLDGIPYVGNLTSQSPNIYVATGFGKWGISNSTAAATILCDLITKGEHPCSEIYNPSRGLTANTIKSFLIQNADVAKNYVSGKLKNDSEDLELLPGDAKVLNIDGKKVGVHRDDNGQLHCIDTTCTHLGCELEWNNAERSWDCPCHGSRFNIDGEVLEGPAFNHLNHPDKQANQVEARIFK